MESRSRQLVIDAGLPAPEPQLELLLPNGFRRLDMGYRQHRIGIEYDGEDFHTGVGTMSRDRERHNGIISAGWVELHLTAADIYRHPERFLADLRELFRLRAPRAR